MEDPDLPMNEAGHRFIDGNDDDHPMCTAERFEDLLAADIADGARLTAMKQRERGPGAEALGGISIVQGAPGHPALSIRRQCSLLGLARAGVYRPARIANDDELALMRRLDELFLSWPFFGSRRMTAMLRAEGWVINRKRGSSSPTGR